MKEVIPPCVGSGFISQARLRAPWSCRKVPVAPNSSPAALSMVDSTPPLSGRSACAINGVNLRRALLADETSELALERALHIVRVPDDARDLQQQDQ